MEIHRTFALLLSPVTFSLATVLTLGSIEGKTLATIVSIVFIVVIPVADVIRKHLNGEVDILVPERAMRGRFLIQAAISYSIGFILLKLLNAKMLSLLALTYLFVTLALIVLNKSITKVSVHMAGITGPATFMLYSGIHTLGFAMMLLIPLLAWSRWRSGSHTIDQVLLGSVVSFLITFLTCHFASVFQSAFELLLGDSHVIRITRMYFQRQGSSVHALSEL